MAVTATKEVAERIAAFVEVEELLPNRLNQLTRDQAASMSKEQVQSEAPSADEEREVTSVIQNEDIEWNVDRINAPDVWDLGYDGEGIVVASIDTGVQWDHPALKEKYAGYDATTGEVDHTYSFFDAVNGKTVPYDTDGHGTHVTGTMVGGEPDGPNQVGVAPGAKWIAVQAFTDDGAYDADLLEAGEWLLAPGGDPNKAPDVVNNSWGGNPGANEWYRGVVNAWRSADIVPVFAAGNVTPSNGGGEGSVANPSNYPESFAVGNTTKDDQIASSSLRGPSPYGDEIKPDVSAPGTDIRSSFPGDNYGSATGTSMAAPAVAGTVALLRQVNNDLTVDQIEEILMETADNATDYDHPESPNNAFGYGIIDAFAAVSSIAEGVGTVNGVVATEDIDEEPAAYEHTPPYGFLSGRGIGLDVFVSDNVSVTSVELRYNGKTVEADQVEGNYRAGTYEVEVAADEITGDSFTYQWVITDFGGHEVVTEEYTVEASDPLFFEDFSEDPGWSFFKGGVGEISWEWGAPTNGPGSALTGENVYATSLSGNYNLDEVSWLEVPGIDVPEGNAFLEFTHWYEIESGYDNGRLAVGNDQTGEFDVLESFTSMSDGWETSTYDISEYSGDTIYIAFIMDSDFMNAFQGWYIDSVTVTDLPILTKTTSNKMNVQVESEANIPLDATVSVLETDRSVKTNIEDGSYSLLHQEGTFTLVAESYGHFSKEQTVEIVEDTVSEANFILEELPKATVSGTVTNANSGVVVEDATLFILEDAVVEPVQTDADGNYDLTAYERDYTLRVLADGYISKDIAVELTEDQTLDIELEPFYTIPGDEIAYDDGTQENARSFFLAGDAWAVHMTLPEGKESALVTEGVFQFYDDSWPVPGGTRFEVEVWTVGEDGHPGEMLAGGIEGHAIRSFDEWTVVDLRKHNIQVEKDFFMVYRQTQINDFGLWCLV